MSCVSLFIEENYDYLLNMSNVYVGREYGGDLLNDLSLAYLEDEKFEEMCERGELMKYISRTMAICGFSANSPFYTKYKKLNDKIVRRYPLEILRQTQDDYSLKTTEETEEKVQAVIEVLKEIRWFDAEVFKSYYLHGHSLRTLSDATGIKKSTLYQAIKTAKAHLKENLERIR